MMTRYPGIEPSKENKTGNGDWTRDEFLFMVLHELRNSTQNIISWTELMCRQPSTDEILSEGLEVIKRNGHLQVTLLKQLFDFLRKRSGDLRPDAGRIALVPILEAAIKSIMPQALAKAISLHAELEPSDASVIGNAAQLEEVFTNLLSNAVKFTPAGGRVEARFRCRPGYAEITVSDTGQGISARFLPHVFDRFRQERESPTGQDGMGLGLAIVRHLVERHGGQIQALSPGKGKGATFKVCFPLAPNVVTGALPSEAWMTSAADRV